MSSPPDPDRIAVARTIGLLIARARERKGVSRAELGRRVGLSATRVGIFESGLARPDADTLERLADALGVSSADLLTVDMEFRVPQ